MRLWPKTKARGWYGPFDLVEDITSPIEKGASWATKDRGWTDWLKDKGSDIEKSRVGGAVLATSPSVGVAYGDEGFQAQAGLNRAQGGPSLTVGQGQRGQENQGRDWGGTIMSLLPILAQGAGSYLQYGREEKDRERMADAQKFSDWVNVIAGRNVATPQFTPSKVSGWEKLANIGGQALQMGQQQRAQAEQNRLRELQIQAAQGSLEAQRAQQEMLQGRGMAAMQQQAEAQDTGPGEGDYVVGGGEVATVEAPRIGPTPYQAIGMAKEERENLAGIIAYANAMAKSGGVLSSKEKASIESAMRKDFNNHKAAKNYFGRAPAYEQIKILATNRDAVNPRTGLKFKSQGARDIGLVFSFMKLLDPPSTVREGEAASAENAGGVPDKWRNTYNRLIEGQRLAESVREEMLFVAESVYKAAELPFLQLSDLYQGVASRTGVDFENIGLNPYSHLQKTEGGGADQATGANVGMSSFFEKVAAGDQEALRIFKQLSPYLD